MRYSLDTNVCIRYLRNPNSPVRLRIAAVPITDIFLCSVVLAELYHGAERTQNPARERARVDGFAAPFVVLPFDERAASYYARVRANLERVNRLIGPFDLQIAAIALVHGLTLVTHNVGEFSRVPGLAVEDWEVP